MTPDATRAFLADQGIGGSCDLRRVAGGDICEAWQVVADCGTFFLKRIDADGPAGLFAAEADGLAALACCDELTVPAVIGFDERHLLLEHLDLRRRTREDDRRLGRALAALHAVDRGTFGWHADNWLGRTPQQNPASDDWPGFFVNARLRPQARLLGGNIGTLAERLAERLAQRGDGPLAGHRPHAALLHGDLWSGNAAALADGSPVLFDPAVHCGDRECDLAMAALFGGFSEDFHAAYAEVQPLPPGHRCRRDLYQLYHVLNHANLFGGSYLAGATRLLERLLAD